MARTLGFKTRTQTDNLEKKKQFTSISVIVPYKGFLWGLFSALPVGA